MIFSYEAKDSAGRTVTGSLDAGSEQAAVSQVRTMGYFLLRLVPQAAQSSNGGAAPVSAEPFALRPARPLTPGQWLLIHLVYPLWSGVSLRDLALFYRQFATLIDAGVPIYQSLTSLLAQTANATLRGCIQSIGEAVRQGGTLSGAMGEYPWIFADYHRAMIMAGEVSGHLDLMFKRLSDALEQEYALRSNIKRELTYPIIVLHCVFLLPPLFILVVQGSVIGYLLAAVLPLVEAYVILALIYAATRIGSQFKQGYDALAATLPGIGGAVRMVALARFARALASLYAAGVAVPKAIRYAAAACGNAFLGEKMVRAIPQIESGRGFTEALAETRAFPPMVISMLGTGEQTGSLDQTMNKVAEYYEQEAVVRLHQLSVTLGVVVLILVGIRVAIFVIGFYTGYFNNLLQDQG